MSAVCPSCQAEVGPEAKECPSCGCIIAMEEPKDPLIGATVGNLVLTSQLGAGGMGAVYRAEHRSLKTPYAVKVLHPQFSNNPIVAERFRREALACTKLRHENVVFVTDFGVQEGVGIYLIMEFLDGKSLKDVYRETGRLTIGRLGHIGGQICAAMSAAHRLGIVHRDLKPDNVIVLNEESRRDFVKVLDFGIAHIKNSGGEENLTQSGVTMGTPTYIAPEQIGGDPGAISAATDIYTLGVIFYEMLAGAPPFARGTTDFAILNHHMSTPAPPVSERFPALSGTQMERLISLMLEKKPSRRPPSMAAVKQMLQEAVQEMQDRGEEDAFYSEDGATDLAPDTQRPAAPRVPTSPSLHVTTLIRKIKQEAPDSPAASLLQALPNADKLGGEALALALWGILQEELLDAPLDSERFGHACSQLALLFDAVLTSHGGSTPTESQKKIFRSLQNMMSVAAKDRHRKLVEVLMPMTQHHLFPQEALGKDTGGKGGWQAFKAAMNKELRLPWKSGSPQKEPAPKEKEPAPRPAAVQKEKGAELEEAEKLPTAYHEHSARGKALYKSEKFTEAIKEFEAAYQIKALPALLFNIAGAYRMLGKPRQALDYFERYRLADPNLPFQVKAKLLDFITDALKQVEELDRREKLAAPPVQAAPAAQQQVIPPGAVVVMAPPGAMAGAVPGGPTPTMMIMPSGAMPVPVPLPGAPTSEAALAETYLRNYEKATKLFKADQIEESIKYFEAAYQAKPFPALLVNLAVAHRKLDNPREALDYFERYQRAEPNLAPEVAAKIQGLISESRRKVQDLDERAKAVQAPTANVADVLDEAPKEKPAAGAATGAAAAPAAAPAAAAAPAPAPAAAAAAAPAAAPAPAPAPAPAAEKLAPAPIPAPPQSKQPDDWDPDAPLMLERDVNRPKEEEKPPEPEKPKEPARAPLKVMPRKPKEEKEVTLSGAIGALFGKKK